VAIGDWPGVFARSPSAIGYGPLAFPLAGGRLAKASLEGEVYHADLVTYRMLTRQEQWRLPTSKSTEGTRS
jgi:hypothetical protein